MSFLSFSSRASGGKTKKARPKSGRGAKLPAVPPEFRLKANTLTAYNGACRIKLLTHKRVLIRSAPKGKAETKRNMLLPAKGALSVKPIFVSRLYQRIFYTQKLYHILDNLSSTKIKKLGSPHVLQGADGMNRAYLLALSHSMLGKSAKMEMLSPFLSR